MEVKRVSKTDKHYFFGFHDIPCTNLRDDFLLGLGVEDMSHPPIVGQKAEVCIFDLKEQEHKGGIFTEAFNYPQGARQQWLENTNQFLVNKTNPKGFGSMLIDADSYKILDEFDNSIYVVSTNAKDAFTIDYARVHRMGGYGYVGKKDEFENEALPKKGGITWHCLKTKKSKIFLSIAEIAQIGQADKQTSFDHYITHLSLSPDSQILVFLHRYRIDDGGETTRLMAVNVDGTDLHCVASGFLSHYCWTDNEHLMIYGREYSSMESMRESQSSFMSLVKKIARPVKPLIKRMISGQLVSDAFWIYNVKDSSVPKKMIDTAILNTDGHPMMNPIYNEWISNDTYPDEEKLRELMLYHQHENKKIHLAKFPENRIVLNLDLKEKFTAGIDPKVLKYFDYKLYGHTRSGAHCDLHPRWTRSGKQLCFDSFHEEKRGMYMMDLTSKML